jgi:kynurenine formamidase
VEDQPPGPSGGREAKTDEQMAKDNAEFGSGEPGVAPEVCDYLASKKISMIGSDTLGTRAVRFRQERRTGVLRLLPYEPDRTPRHL